MISCYTLEIEEQIDNIQLLWDDMAAGPEQVPVPDWHKQILTEQLSSHEANPSEGKAWEEFEEELLQELKRHRE